MRCFVAVDVSPEARAALARAQAKARAGAPRADVRWVEPAGLHVTLKFLGEVRDAIVPEVAAALEAAAGRVAPLPLTMRGLGGFPSLGRPRVLWAGLTDGADALGCLAVAVERALQPLGFAPEARPFHAHVTIARVRSPRGGRRLAQAVEAAGALALGSWTAEEVVLYRSRLRPTGAVYEALSRHRLRGLDD